MGSVQAEVWGASAERSPFRGRGVTLKLLIFFLSGGYSRDNFRGVRELSLSLQMLRICSHLVIQLWRP